MDHPLSRPNSLMQQNRLLMQPIMSGLQHINTPFFSSMPPLQRKLFLKSWVTQLHGQYGSLPLNGPMGTRPWREFQPCVINCAISPRVIILFLNLVEDLKIFVTNSQLLVNLLMNLPRPIGSYVVLGLRLRPSLQLFVLPVYLLLFVI